MIHYLQQEQKKRFEELREIERRIEKLKLNPKFKKLIELAEKRLKEHP